MAERITVGELFDNLENNYTIRHKLTPQIRSKLKPLRAAFGTMSALRLSDSVVQDYIRIRQQGVPANKINLSRLELSLRDFGPIADATINRETQLLKQAFKLKKKVVGEGPDILKLPENNVREGFFERAEFESIVAALPEDLQDFARFDYLTGWRKGELESLGWTELDMEGRELRLRASESKNGESRKVSLTGELWEIIQRRWQARMFKDEDGNWHISPLVFFRLKGRGVPKAGAPVKEFRKVWAAACEAAGLPGRHFHDFRRTAARNMRRAGVSEEVAMKITGHKTPSIFKHGEFVLIPTWAGA
jgi:integrase